MRDPYHEPFSHVRFLAISVLACAKATHLQP